MCQRTRCGIRKHWRRIYNTEPKLDSSLDLDQLFKTSATTSSRVCFGKDSSSFAVFSYSAKFPPYPGTVQIYLISDIAPLKSPFDIFSSPAFFCSSASTYVTCHFFPVAFSKDASTWC